MEGLLSLGVNMKEKKQELWGLSTIPQLGGAGKQGGGGISSCWQKDIEIWQS